MSFLFFIFLLFVIHLLIPFNFICFCLHVKVLNFYFVFFILASLCLVMSIIFWFLILFYFLHCRGHISMQAVLDRMRDPYGLLGMLALLPLLEVLDAFICFA